MMGGSAKKKPDDLWGVWKRIFAYIKRYRYMLLLTALLSAVASALSLFGPYYISEMTDLIEDGIGRGMDMDRIKALGIILVAIYLLSGFIQFFENYMMATVSQRSAQMLRKDISRKMNRIPLSYFDQSSKGDVMSRVTNDVDTLGMSMNQCIGSLVSSTTVIIGATVIMLYMNLALAVLTLAVASVGFIVIKQVAKRTQKYFRSQQKNLGNMNGLVEEQYSGHMTVSLYAGQEEAIRRFDEINRSLSHSAFFSQFLGSISSHINGLISNIGYVLVCVVGAMLYLDGRASFGIIVAFMIYVKLFTGSFVQISSSIVTMQSVAASAERVFTFLDYREMEAEEPSDRPSGVRGEIEFRNVSFGYAPETKVINDLSLRIATGQRVAIVGPTGSGKTTLVNLLLRFYEIDAGDILIDGRSIRSFTRSELREMFGMVLQETWMFEGTLRQNIQFSRSDVTDGEMMVVCDSVGLSHYISTLPQGLDTPMDDEDSISVGQKQQVTIARAILKKPDMIILDEATSSVDPLTELKIQSALEDMMSGRTSIIIAHRLSTIVNSDLIVAMRNGRIIETGTHKELMARNGFYRELYESQFSEGS